MMYPIVQELGLRAMPVEVLRRIHRRRGSFLLESALTEHPLSRYSIIGFDPFLVFRAKDSQIEITEGTKRELREGPPLKELRKLLLRYPSASHATLPFTGGAVGFFSYEFGAKLENVSRRLPDDPTVPDIELGFHDGVLLYQHATARWLAVANPVYGGDPEAILRRLTIAAEAPLEPEIEQLVAEKSGSPRAAITREQYIAAVGRIKEYIAAGDVYQVNVAQSFQVPMHRDAFQLYLRLRERSPAPFAAYLATSIGQIVSCSPERFLQVRGKQVETRPIKGTRPRGRNETEDKRLSGDLLASDKERAELLMIVDLERNDLGRVCVPGSIEVTQLYGVEAHPTVFHLVATITGTLRPDRDVWDLLAASFPGGSITGAPKIRAMQVIDEVEQSRRNIYTGSIGYIGFDGSCDLNIAIRTIVCSGGMASYHVGAGIVWDSDPDAEYEETLAKGRALSDALTGASQP